jgi:hypothetical protein
MSKAIEKMKQVVSKMPEGWERRQAEQCIKNLEIFEEIADSFEVIVFGTEK